VRERLTILVIVGTSMDEHSLRSRVGIGSESDCLFGQLDRILWTSDSEAGVKTEKSGGVPGGEGECRDDVVGLLLVGRQEEHPACIKNSVMRCWCGYLPGARCRLFAHGPADDTASQNHAISCLISIQIGF